MDPAGAPWKKVQAQDKKGDGAIPNSPFFFCLKRTEPMQSELLREETIPVPARAGRVAICTAKGLKCVPRLLSERLVSARSPH